MRQNGLKRGGHRLVHLHQVDRWTSVHHPLSRSKSAADELSLIKTKRTSISLAGYATGGGGRMSTFLVHLSTSVHQGDPNLMTDDQSLDPELAARLRAASEQRIAEQIQAARTRADEQRAVRADFAARRTAGLRNRYAAKQARLRMIANHNSEEAP